MGAPGDRGLLRAIRRWDLLALVINGIVGAGIFGLPAKVHALLGVNGLWAIVACAVIIGLVVLCFAEVASRFEQTGGPFVYAGAAFGPLTGFLTGWRRFPCWIFGVRSIGAGSRETPSVALNDAFAEALHFFQLRTELQ
jgi:amino acid transporter